MISPLSENLGYRFVMLSDGKAAMELESAIKRGALPIGKPLLNVG